MLEINNKYNLFEEYPDVVTFEDMRKMLGGIGRTTAYKLVNERKFYSKKVAREFRIPKNSIIEYLMSDSNEGGVKYAKNK